MNLRTGRWDSVLLDIFGIEKNKLCDLIDPGELHGYTNEKLEFEVFDGFIGYDSMDYTRDKKQYNTEAVAIKLGFDF